MSIHVRGSTRFDFFHERNGGFRYQKYNLFIIFRTCAVGFVSYIVFSRLGLFWRFSRLILMDDIMFHRYFSIKSICYILFGGKGVPRGSIGILCYLGAHDMETLAEIEALKTKMEMEQRGNLSPASN